MDFAICPTERYCCENPGSWWCGVCGVECPSGGGGWPTPSPVPPPPGLNPPSPPIPNPGISLPQFPGRDRVIEIDRLLAASKDQVDHQLVIEMAKILEKAGGARTAEQLLSRIPQLNLADLTEAGQARDMVDVLKYRSRLLNKLRRQTEIRLKELGG